VNEQLLRDVLMNANAVVAGNVMVAGHRPATIRAIKQFHVSRKSVPTHIQALLLEQKIALKRLNVMDVKIAAVAGETAITARVAGVTAGIALETVILKIHAPHMFQHPRQHTLAEVEWVATDLPAKSKSLKQN